MDHTPVFDFRICGHQTQVHHENLSENSVTELSVSVEKTTVDLGYKTRTILKLIAIIIALRVTWTQLNEVHLGSYTWVQSDHK